MGVIDLFLTIFTPTYNRDYILPKLYKSLCQQTCKDFEWVLVDDGSTDTTGEMANNWLSEKKINMRFIKQKNSGKPIAHNKGVSEAKGDLFVCVDSDDYLLDNAVEEIKKLWTKIRNRKITGILSFRCYSNKSPLTTLQNSKIKESTLREAYKKHGLHGDTMLIFKTDIIRKYHFVVANGERFIPEDYLYNQIDNDGPMYIYRKALYVCEYQKDGLTANVAQNLFSNYKSYVIYCNAKLKSNENIIDKFMDTMRYEAIMIAHREKNIIRNAVYPWMAVIGWIPAFIFSKKRYGECEK